MIDMERQQWIPVMDYEGLYDISNYGHIYSYDTDSFRKPTMGSKYLHIGLTKDGKQTTFTLHKLIARHFVENDDPMNKTEVHHIDCNKFNNHADNLMWVTPEQHNLIHKETHKKYLSKEVEQYTLDGVKVAEYPSTREAAIAVKGSRGHISNCCLGKRGAHKGYIWKYKNRQ